MFSSTRTVLARRAARLAFGLVLLAGMSWIVAVSIADHGGWWDGVGASRERGDLHAMAAFPILWLVAAGTYTVVRVAVWIAAPAPRGDALLRASLVAPAAGLAFALPLSLHWLWFLVVGGDLDAWIAISIRVVAVAHVVFAITFAMHASQLARSDAPTMSISSIFMWSVFASVIPWGLLIVPEALTAITGLCILPVLFGFDAIARAERDALPTLPAARSLP